MNANLLNRISQITLKPSIQCHNLIAFPIMGEDMENPDHLMLEEALDKGVLTVEEVNEGGSVPDLVVVNDSDEYILLLDGEEVAGAKQNRVLNTTILLDKRSRTTVPVSCTEQGRWAYQTEKFYKSGRIMSSKLRGKKTQTVTSSLKSRKSYASDQSEVWNSITTLHDKAGTSSATGAMKEAYEKRQKKLDEYTGAIPVADDQIGMLVFIDGKPAGLDLFSRPQSFAKVAKQLAESYAMDAITSEGASDENGGDKEKEKKRKKADNAATVTLEQARDFILGLGELKEDPFESVGIGSDYRYEGDDRAGTALVVETTPIHASFYASFDQGDGDALRKVTSRSHRFGSLIPRRITRRDSREEEQE